MSWGGRDRTYEWRRQRPLPYRLATPQLKNKRGYYSASPIACKALCRILTPMSPYWFKPKQFWKYFAAYYPATWQGWVLTGLLLVLAGLIFGKIDSTSHSVSDTLINFAPYAIMLGLLFDFICFRTGEYPAWWKKRR